MPASKTDSRRFLGQWLLGRPGCLIAVGVLVLLAGCATAPVPQAPEIAARATALTPRETANLRVFDAAWSLVNRKFHDPRFRGVDWPAAAVTYGPKTLVAANDEQLYGVINTMLAGLKESHNWASLPGQSAEDREMPRARLGFSLARQENHWVVMAVQPGGPAAAAGLRPGWLFVTRNGQPLGVNANFKLQEGETVTGEFLDRQDRTHLLTMTARLLPPAEAREARELDGGVWYLRFDRFDWDSHRWLSDQLKAHRTAPAVVVDLRQNPGGGSLSLGITIGEFFPHSVEWGRFNNFDRASRRWLSDQLKAHRTAPAVVVDLRQNPGGDSLSLGITVGEFFPHSVDWGRFIGRNGRSHEEDSWQWGSARYAGRVAVLVGRGTASSAEIFAHALQFHRRAVLVGRPTAGAVVGSRFYRLPGGGKLQLGVYDYQGLDSRRLEGVGVKPDVVVSLKLDDLRDGVDPDLAAALVALQNPTAATKNR